MFSSYTDEEELNRQNEGDLSLNDTMKNSDEFGTFEYTASKDAQESNQNGEVQFNYDIDDPSGVERVTDDEANKEKDSVQVELTANSEEDDEDDSDDENGTVNVVIDMVKPNSAAAALNRQKSITKPVNGTTVVPLAGQTSTTTLGNTNSLNVPKLPQQQPLKGVDVEAPGTINDVPTFDYDLAEVKDEDKPWRKPGADITDYFNYGFSEESWILYCMKQKRLRAENSSFKVIKL